MDIKKAVLDYFQATENYFWQWTENGTVLEWPDGRTICYREDLLGLLEQLIKSGVPPLGPILLVLSACQDNWESMNKMDVMPIIFPALRSADPSRISELGTKLDKVFLFLDHIHSLSAEYRKGNQRVVLLESIFGEQKKLIPENEFRPILFAFGKGEYDSLLFQEKKKLDMVLLHKHLDCFVNAQERFSTSEALELKVRTGLLKIPESIKIELPEEETGKADVMESLEKNPQTNGFARLTRQIMAALKSPIHSISSNEQVFGGVSDISNRGNFDRLLLSELANDDMLLMARLANNEALYLRKEELPDKTQRERIVLVDVTIRMWGLPRIFAFAASLACGQIDTGNTTIKVYALAGNNYVQLDYSSMNGVINALENIDSTMHCGLALKEFLIQETKNAEAEYYFITNEVNFSYPDFQYYYSEHNRALDYLIKLNRQGELQFCKLSDGKQKILCAAEYDLKVLLSTELVVPYKRRTNGKNFPAFIQIEPAPLYFPTAKINLTPKTTFDSENLGMINVTKDNRLLYWSDKNKGALEWLDVIEEGMYHFALSGTKVFVLVSSFPRNAIKLYWIDQNTNSIKVFDYENEINEPKEIFYAQGEFHIRSKENKYFIIPISQDSIKVLGKDDVREMEQMRPHALPNRPNFKRIKKFVNNGYSVISKARSIYINPEDRITIDGHVITIANDTTLRIHETHIERKAVKFSSSSQLDYVLEGFSNNKVKFSKFMFKDGSEIIVDSRGLLHLKSSNATIPEITIVLVLSQPTACWSSDNKVCGNSYFTGIDRYKTMKVEEFYELYIHRFIMNLG